MVDVEDIRIALRKAKKERMIAPNSPVRPPPSLQKLLKQKDDPAAIASLDRPKTPVTPLKLPPTRKEVLSSFYTLDDTFHSPTTVSCSNTYMHRSCSEKFLCMTQCIYD